MRKIVFILMLILSLGASAQRYTLQMGQREPTFYYYGQHWIDYCENIGNLEYAHGGGYLEVPRTFLRFFTTRDTLKIIGLAGACRIHPPQYNTDGRWETAYDTSTISPEYFQLYDCAVDSTPIFIAEARWDTAHPRYQYVYYTYRIEWDTTYYPGSGHGTGVYVLDTTPIYEAFFDKPILMTDSFYVGATTHNSTLHYDESLNQYRGYEHFPTEYLGIHRQRSNTYYDMFPCPTSPRRTLTYRDHPDIYNPNYTTPELDRVLARYDTNWHHDLGTATLSDGTTVYTSAWLCLFPIIDTTGMGLDGFVWVDGYGGCDSVRSFYLMYFDGRKAYLYWRGPGDELYGEVSYGPAGTTPAQGTKMNVTTSVICLDSLMPGQEYVAYVRARCPENAKSPWTEGVRFRMPGSGGEVEEASMASRYTDVMPNPTSGQATVISSFTIGRIEVYTAAGQHVLTTEPKANAAALDLSTLSAGTYLLRIQTSAGDTAKRLVVQ